MESSSLVLIWADRLWALATTMTMVHTLSSNSTITISWYNGRRRGRRLVDLGRRAEPVEVGEIAGLHRGVGGDVIDEIEFVQDWMRRNMNRTNPLLVRQFAAESGKALDWILSHLDSAIIENCGIFGVPKPTAYPGEISGYRSVCNGQQLWRTLRPAVLHPYRRYQHRVGHHHGQDRRRDRGGVVIRSLSLPHKGPRASVRGPLWGRPFQP